MTDRPTVPDWSDPSRGRRRVGRWSLVAAVVLAGLAGLAMACGSDQPEAWAGAQRIPAPVVSEQTLPAVEADGSAEPFTFAADDGELLLVYFGYTSCPDVCPTTLSDVRAISDDLGSEADRLDLAMVTIDPEVDTPERLASYVRSFLPEAVAIRTTTDADLRAAADAFGADYGVLDAEGEPQVYHTGSLYAVDDQGRLVLSWPFGIARDDLQRDLTRLFDELPEAVA